MPRRSSYLPSTVGFSLDGLSEKKWRVLSKLRAPVGHSIFRRVSLTSTGLFVKE